jgi:large subunit ribosomal protein L5
MSAVAAAATSLASDAAAALASPSLRAAARPLRRRPIHPTRRPPPLRKPLALDPSTRLPVPHVRLTLGDTGPSRLLAHYHATLADDLMYLTYTHQPGARRAPRAIRLTYDPADPYVRHRANPPVGGAQPGRAPAPASTPANVVRLEKIVVHTMQKDAIANRQQLLGAIMALRAISGETARGGGRHTKAGVQVIRGKKSSGSSWKGKNAPLACKVELTGPRMYHFLETLAEFVFPRLREFDGLLLPPAKADMRTPSGVGGVVEFGLEPEAMGLFPEIEVNVEAYPRLYGMNIHCITNAEGQGAQDKARALISGFQIPFIRRPYP